MALELSQGTLIFVSHDRELVSSLATRILEITPERVMTLAVITKITCVVKGSSK